MSLSVVIKWEVQAFHVVTDGYGNAIHQERYPFATGSGSSPEAAQNDLRSVLSTRVALASEAKDLLP